MTLAEHDRKTLLSQDEMMTVFAAKVRQIYGLSVKEYVRMRRTGTLPYKPEGAGLEVLSGEGDCRQLP